MLMAEWWPRLRPLTRDWLIANNGDVVPEWVTADIAEAGGPAATDGWWTTDGEASGPVMPDAAIDWIEETANGETYGED